VTPEQQALRELMPVVAMLENAGHALADREPALFAEALKEAFERYAALPSGSPVLTLYRKWLTTHGP
jgi:hypothetical protein